MDNIKRHLIEGSFFAAIIIFMFPANIRIDADCGDRDSHIDHLDVRADGGDGIHSEPDHFMLALTLMVGT